MFLLSSKCIFDNVWDLRILDYWPKTVPIELPDHPGITTIHFSLSLDLDLHPVSGNVAYLDEEFWLVLRESFSIPNRSLLEAMYCVMERLIEVYPPCKKEFERCITGIYMTGLIRKIRVL